MGDEITLPSHRKKHDIASIRDHKPVAGAVSGNLVVIDPATNLPIKDSGTSLASILGGINIQGEWDALTNTPVLASGVGVAGNGYIVSVAGATDLDGITDWNVKDIVWFDGVSNTWKKIDNTDSYLGERAWARYLAESIGITPPVTPVDDGYYLIQSVATGIWAGKSGQVGHYTTAGGWVYTIPKATDVWATKPEKNYYITDGAASWSLLWTKINHSNLLGLTTDNHHAKAHAHDGTDGSGTVSHSNLSNLDIESSGHTFPNQILTRYSSGNGSDITGDGSIRRPYATIQKCVDQAIIDGWRLLIVVVDNTIDKVLETTNIPGGTILDVVCITSMDGPFGTDNAYSFIAGSITLSLDNIQINTIKELAPTDGIELRLEECTIIDITNSVGGNPTNSSAILLNTICNSSVLLPRLASMVSVSGIVIDIAGDVIPLGNLNMNLNKITSLADGTIATDGMAFGQRYTDSEAQAAVKYQPTVTLAGVAPVDADVVGWADDDRGLGEGTGGRQFVMEKRGTAVRYVEMAGHNRLHAGEHVDGTDDIQDATDSQKGLMTLAQAGKLDLIADGATKSTFAEQSVVYFVSETRGNDGNDGGMFSPLATVSAAVVAAELAGYGFAVIMLDSYAGVKQNVTLPDGFVLSLVAWGVENPLMNTVTLGDGSEFYTKGVDVNNIKEGALGYSSGVIRIHNAIVDSITDNAGTGNPILTDIYCYLARGGNALLANLQNANYITGTMFNESDGKLHSFGGFDGVEPTISPKNTAFNKNFGTGATDACAGNDARLSDQRVPTDLSVVKAKLGFKERADIMFSFPYTGGKFTYNGTTLTWDILDLYINNIYKEVTAGSKAVAANQIIYATVTDYTTNGQAFTINTIGYSLINNLTANDIIIGMTGAAGSGQMFLLYGLCINNVVIHALGGAEHTADTLANLNAKITGVTLVDPQSTTAYIENAAKRIMLSISGAKLLWGNILDGQIFIRSGLDIIGVTLNNAFNKSFGTEAGTVCEGNDSRLTGKTHSPWILDVYGTGGVLFPNNATGFCHIGQGGAITSTEVLAQIRMPKGRVRAIQGYCSAGSGSFTVRKNGVATTLTGLVNSVGQFYIIGAGAIEFAESDLLSLYYNSNVGWTVYGIQIKYETELI